MFSSPLCERCRSRLNELAPQPDELVAVLLEHISMFKEFCSALGAPKTGRAAQSCTTSSASFLQVLTMAGKKLLEPCIHGWNV